MKGRLAAVFVLLVALPSVSRAHPLAPTSIQVTLESDTEVHVAFVGARAERRIRRLSVALPHDCQEIASPSRSAGTRYRCVESLPGRRLSVRGLVPNGPVAMLSVVGEGVAQRVFLDAYEPGVRVETRSGVVSALGLGARHLLGGFDHVLLVVGLIALLAAWRDRMVALFGFTLGHALALAVVVVLDLWPPSSLVEAAIAGTLVALGFELGSSRGGPTQRAPALVPSLVGLVHGAGFAGVFRDAGLTRDALLGTLVPFHLGLEVAQLGVALAAALGLGWLARRGVSPARTLRILGAVIGGAAILVLFPEPFLR